MTSTTSRSGPRADGGGRRLARGAVAFLFWLVVWQLASMAIGQELLLVSPVAVVRTLATLVVTRAFWASVGYSFVRIIGGFLLAVVVGILLAALSGASGAARTLLAPLMLVLKSVPVVSFIILVLIWADSSTLSLVISFLIVVPVIHTNVLEGIDRTDPKLLELARVFRIPLWRRFRAIDIPAIIPHFTSGARIGLGLCWKSGIAAEVIGLSEGSIGERLYQAKIFLSTAELFAWTIVIVLVSFLFERFFLALLRRFELRLSRWGA